MLVLSNKRTLMQCWAWDNPPASSGYQADTLSSVCLLKYNPRSPTAHPDRRAIKSVSEGLLEGAWHGLMQLLRWLQDERPFVSCKKVMMDMGEPYSKHELLSFHTISKGALGECGLRGGYVEATNIHPGTIDQIYKIASINLSPNTTGQVLDLITGLTWSSRTLGHLTWICAKQPDRSTAELARVFNVDRVSPHKS